MTWVIRMTTEGVKDGYILNQYKDRDEAIKSLHDIRERYDEYVSNPIVNARSIFRYSDASTKFILSWE